MATAQQQSKKQKYSQNETERNAGGVYPFHPEDDEIRKVCGSIQCGFDQGLHFS
jgi:hypothetical protein